MGVPATALVYGLTDASGRDLGRVRVESMDGNLVLGEFEPGSDYPAVEPVFRRFAEIVEDGVFSLLDQVEAEVRQVGVRLRVGGPGDAVPVWDVQIYPDGGFSCRLPAAGERNGSHP